MQSLTLPATHALSGEVHLPGSKSISNRALLLAAFAEGSTTLHNLLHSDDTQHMLRALRTLGVQWSKDGGVYTIAGQNGPLTQTDEHHDLSLGLAGTAIRPLTAALTLGVGTFTLDGTQRMRERPIAHLVDTLKQLGARISYNQKPGFAPLTITGTGLNGGDAQIDGSLSSQFLTSVLLAAPLAAGPIAIRVSPALVSKPYVDITLALMNRFGVNATHDDYQHFRCEPQSYRSPGDFLVEGDASSASYFLAAGAIRGEGIRVNGIGTQSMQGDVAFTNVLKTMGANVHLADDHIDVNPGTLRGIDADLNHIPDAAMTVAVLALFAEGATCIRNIHNWRVKETDRLDAMATELRKLGAKVTTTEDSIHIEPPAQPQSAVIDTYGDHRMAMCFSLAALAGVPVTINDPRCVDKTFPEYFTVFDRLSVVV